MVIAAKAPGMGCGLNYARSAQLVQSRRSKQSGELYRSFFEAQLVRLVVAISCVAIGVLIELLISDGYHVYA
jgi:hypothetical protein